MVRAARNPTVPGGCPQPVAPWCRVATWVGTPLALALTTVGGRATHGVLPSVLLLLIGGERVVAGRRHRRELARAWALAHTDELTSLANRRALMARLDDTLTGDRAVGLLLVDLNGFKFINDAYGHGVGDRVLRVVADRLTTTVGPGCLVARLGGDEFAITTPDPDPDQLAWLANQVRAALTGPITVDRVRLSVTASIGTTVGTSGEVTPAGLLARADAQMYHAKTTNTTPAVPSEAPAAPAEGDCTSDHVSQCPAAGTTTGPATPVDHADAAARALAALEHETTDGQDYLWPSQIHATINHLWLLTSRLSPVLNHTGSWLDAHHRADRTRHLRAPDAGPDVHAALTTLAAAITATRQVEAALAAARQHTQHLTATPYRPETR